MRPRTFGEILDGAFQICRRHAVPLAITTLISYGVFTLLMLTLMSRIATASNGAPDASFFLLFIPIWIVGFCTIPLAWGALSWDTSEAWLGSPVKVGEGYRVAARAFFRLLGTFFFSTLLFYVAMIPLVIVVGIVGAIVAGAAGAAGGQSVAPVIAVVMGITMVVGFLAGMVGVGGWLACVIPATVIEGLGPFRAIGRSFDLTRGAVMRSGATMLVAGLIVMLPMLGFMLLTGQLTRPFTNPGSVPPMSMLLIQQLGGLVANSFTMPFLMAVMTVLYYDRRVRTEALDVQLAAHDLAEQEVATSI